MEENYKKLGIQDFFNVLFAGAVFAICIIWIEPFVWFWFVRIEGNDALKYLCTAIVLYAIGLCLQELGSIIDGRIFKIKTNAISTYLWKAEKYREDVLEKKVLYKMCSKIDKKHNVFYKDKTIIGNGCKQQVYRENAKQILIEKNLEIEKEFTMEQCGFIYAYCYYYVEALDRHTKYEKMRALFDLARTLCSSTLLLCGVVWGDLFYNMCKWGKGSIAETFIKTLVFCIIAIIFYCRADKLMKYKVRMLMEVYDICIVLKKQEDITMIEKNNTDTERV